MSGEHSQNDPRKTAQEVLISVTKDDELRKEYPTMAEAVDEQSLRQLVDLAWRYQFDVDRYAFKRDIRKLEDYVAKRVKDALGAE